MPKEKTFINDILIIACIQKISRIIPLRIRIGLEYVFRYITAFRIMLDNDESEVDICRIIDKDSEFELNNYGSNRIFGWLYCVGLEIDVTELENIRTDFAF